MRKRCPEPRAPVLLLIILSLAAPLAGGAAADGRLSTSQLGEASSTLARSLRGPESPPGSNHPVPHSPHTLLVPKQRNPLVVFKSKFGEKVIAQKGLERARPNARSFLGHDVSSRPFSAYSSVRDSATGGADDRAGGLSAVKWAASADMVADPRTLLDGQDVVISWSGVKNAQASDYVAIYCGEPSDLKDHLDYKLIGKDQTGGSGSLVFSNLINMRCDYHFIYFQSDELYPTCYDTIDGCTTQLPGASCDRFVCPKHCNLGFYETYVYGSDTYAPGSVICDTAIHAGVLDDSVGGPVRFRTAPGQDSYPSTTRNGIESFAFGPAPVSYVPMMGDFTPAPPRPIAAAVVQMRQRGAPMHPRLAVTGDPSEMRLVWTWATKAGGAVQYWNANDPMRTVAVDKVTTYSAADLCGSPANITSQSNFMDPGHFHHALMTGLIPGDLYTYRFGSDDGGWSDEFEFRAAKAVGPEVGVNMVVYGDMGVDMVYRGDHYDAGNTLLRATALASSQPVDVVLHFGDLSYALGLGYIWEEWGRLITPLAGRVPYMVSVGNHEYDYMSGGTGKDPSGPSVKSDGMWNPPWAFFEDDSAGECGVPTFHRYHMPAERSAGNSIFWYSFNNGNTHIIQMSTEHDFSPSSAQYAWLESDLASVNRSATPYVVLTGHRPMYTSAKIGGVYDSDYVMSITYRQLYEDLLYKHKVDLALWGHYHSYERTCPVYNGTCGDGFPVHIVVGTAGAEVEPADFGGPAHEWSVAHGWEYGFGQITTTSEELSFRFIRNRDGGINDEVVIKNKFPAPNPRSSLSNVV